MELYLVRHAQSENNALMHDQHLRIQDPDITETGVKQAEHLARFLVERTNAEELMRHKVDAPERERFFRHKITHLYCSPMKRTLRTALPIANALNITPEVWVDIHEHGGIYLEDEHGVATGFGGMSRTEILAEFPDYVLPDHITEAGWWRIENAKEDEAMCYARAIRVGAALIERSRTEEGKDDCLMIVSHGMFIDCLLKALWNTIPSDSYYYLLYNTSVTRLDLHQNGRMLIRYINRVAHLPVELLT